jgi:8-oxo-dGTP pyrophosphatase MutT (NUDIX family)
VKHVVAAIIVHEGRIFLTQRRPGKSFPLTWECPGGCVEDGETQEAALRRELDEEIGIKDADIADLEAAHVDVEMTGDGLPVGLDRSRSRCTSSTCGSGPRPCRARARGRVAAGSRSARRAPSALLPLHLLRRVSWSAHVQVPSSVLTT